MIETHKIQDAVNVLKTGGIIAYPTEFCFGLGCDPQNIKAIERLLSIKQRRKEQGVILIAADVKQINHYADLDAVPDLALIKQTWPGPNTWILPALNSVTNWVKGTHSTIALRIPGYDLCRNLCQEFGGAIVSTSANRHGQESLLDASTVQAEFADQIDFILDAPVQFGAPQTSQKASTIRDAMTGKQLR